MSYIGNIPGENFISFAKQNFTIVNSQTAYTLNFSVADENEIRLVINNVVQEPGSGKAYTASGTTLTLSSALTNGTDEMYCVFLGKARETVTVPTITKDKVNFISDGTGSGVISKGDGSVDGSISLNCSQNSHFTKISSAAHGAYSGNLNFVLPSSHGSSGQFLKTDGSGNLSFAAAGGDNTPAFQAKFADSTTQSISNSVDTKVQFTEEVFDTDSAYDNSSNYRFTPGVAGKYFLYASIRNTTNTDFDIFRISIRKNGTQIQTFMNINRRQQSVNISATVDSNTTDYFEIYVSMNDATYLGNENGNNGDANYFGGYKLIT